VKSHIGPAADSKELMVVVEISDAKLVLDAMDSLGVEVLM
jgi:hypothetical protein